MWFFSILYALNTYRTVNEQFYRPSTSCRSAVYKTILLGSDTLIELIASLYQP